MEKQKKNCVLESFTRINATPEYVAKNEIARHAISELSNVEQESIVSKEQCVNWLNRYKFFYKNFNGRGPLFFPTLWGFYSLYNDVNRYMNCLKLNNETLTALAGFKEVNLESETSLLKWLVTYESLYHDIPCFEQTENVGYIYLSEKLNIVVSAVDFSDAIEVKNLFSLYYIDLLVKYKLDLCSRTALKELLKTKTK